MVGSPGEAGSAAARRDAFRDCTGLIIKFYNVFGKIHGEERMNSFAKQNTRAGLSPSSRRP